MKSVFGWDVALKSSGVRPTASITSEKRYAAVIPTGKPISSASSERFAISPRRSTSATQSPAIGPNSGPTTIAPMIRIGESSRMPTEAIRQARTMNSRKLAESSVFSEVRASTSSQTTASDGSPDRRLLGRLRGIGDHASRCPPSRSSPRRSIPNSFRSLTMTLASSRATSHQDHVPLAACGRPARRKTRLHAEGVASQQVEARARSCGRERRSADGPCTASVPPCSPTTTCTFAPTTSARPRRRSPRRTSTATSPPLPRPGSRSSASPSTSTASPTRCEIWEHPYWRSQANDDLGAYCEFVRTTPLKLGIEGDFIRGAEDRIAPAAGRARLRLRGRLGSLPRRRRRGRRPAATTSGPPTATRTSSGGATSSGSPRPPARACSTSSPTRTW